MAGIQPLRIFFGKFYPADSPYADLLNPDQDDQAYGSFVTGRVVGAGEGLHTRWPHGSAGQINDWDEYIDIVSAETDPDKANGMVINSDMSGVQTAMRWHTPASYLNLPTNVYPIEAWVNEYLKPTRRLSKPYPIPSVAQPGTMAWMGDGYHPDNIDKTLRLYMVLRQDGTTSVGSPSSAMDIHCTDSHNQTIRLFNPNNFTVEAAIYVAELERNATTGEMEMLDFPKLITNLDFSDTHISANSYTDINEEMHALVVSSTYLELPALNNALAIIKMSYERNHLIAVDGSWKHEIMVMNYATHEYKKGLIIGCSPVFLEGIPRSPRESAQFVLQVTEEGMFFDDALTLPNGKITPIGDGTTTSPGSWEYLIDSGADFISDGVLPGDKVWNGEYDWWTVVVEVIDLNTLKLLVFEPLQVWDGGVDYIIERRDLTSLVPNERLT